MQQSKLFKNKVVLITGGTGSFGKAFVRELITNHEPKSVRIFSRDEFKQWKMKEKFHDYPNADLLRFFIGDVRDKDRLKRAFDGTDIVIHAAALKQIPAAEYNPFEFIKTNILGAANVIDASIDCGVKKVVALSTDKAAHPINLYGATKLCSEKLFIAANNMKGDHDIVFSVVRYGNVMGSRGSVVPFFLKQKHEGTIITITHPEMTRFNILMNEAIGLVLFVLDNALGGEIFVPKIPSFKIVDLAKAIAPDCKYEIVGTRPGEKIHEEMITEEDSLNTVEFYDYFVIAPTNPNWDINEMIKQFGGEQVRPGFVYNSNTNKDRLSVTDLQNLIKKYFDPNIAAIENKQPLEKTEKIKDNTVKNFFSSLLSDS